MRHGMAGFFFLLVFGWVLHAQPSNLYLFAAPGGVTCGGYTSMTLQFGAGGEYVIGKGVGAGVELGVLGPRESFGDSAVGVFSLNGYYHARHQKELKLDPFVTGGYTTFFREGHANLFNYGGGANYWFARRAGFRLEFRDQVHVNGSAVHNWGARFGIAFRV